MTASPLREAACLHETQLLDCKTVCTMLGGTRPLNPSTLYRHVAKGRYPAPIKVGPNTSRWLRVEVEAALQAMIARRAEQ
jgi:predicted DNA-binding transcriptional regulator AlpA